MKHFLESKLISFHLGMIQNQNLIEKIYNSYNQNITLRSLNSTIKLIKINSSKL